jgi:hypothetical protein
MHSMVHDGNVQNLEKDDKTATGTHPVIQKLGLVL